MFTISTSIASANSVNGFVKRFERGNMIVDLGNLEAILPRSQQSRGEQWNQGERIPRRHHQRLEGIKRSADRSFAHVAGTARAPLRNGSAGDLRRHGRDQVLRPRTRRARKIAVVSNERDVDPVGACVGMKGSRVQAIIRELRGEKIDIIEWSEEPSVFAANALSPAKVNQVRITDIENRQMEVIVNEDQLSLAIGKRGQNVRLATKLVGWNIDIRSEEELKKEVTEAMGAMIASGAPVPLSAIEGVTVQQADALAEHASQILTVWPALQVDDLVEFLDVSLDEAQHMLEAAQAVVAVREQRLAEQAGEEGRTATRGIR
jgi:N utilization substance protein A